jgi:uncharacterized protein (TIGR00290 family)
MTRVLLSWSSGKDCAWALHVLRLRPDLQVVGLLTTFNESANRVAMHAVRRELVEAQAEAAGVSLWPVMLPWPCSNEQYEAIMRDVIARAKAEGVEQIAFGDLFLEDVRDYRIRMMQGTGIEPVFPVWSSPEHTLELARKMMRQGVRAVITCVDPTQISEKFAGRDFDELLLADLPAGADPCGERGEFHTFCYDGPMFRREIPVRVGEPVTRDGFAFRDLMPEF